MVETRGEPAHAPGIEQDASGSLIRCCKRVNLQLSSYCGGLGSAKLLQTSPSWHLKTHIWKKEITTLPQVSPNASTRAYLRNDALCQYESQHFNLRKETAWLVKPPEIPATSIKHDLVAGVSTCTIQVKCKKKQ